MKTLLIVDDLEVGNVAILQAIDCLPGDKELCLLLPASHPGVNISCEVVRFEGVLNQFAHVGVIKDINERICPACVAILVNSTALRPKANNMIPFSYHIKTMEHFFWIDKDSNATDISVHMVYRAKHNRPWKQLNDEFSVREFDSYEDYITVQQSKYKYYEQAIKEDSEKSLYPLFLQRFPYYSSHLNKGDEGLCVGARSGWEVRAFRELGYSAKGIDVFPGKDNPYVVLGDAHEIPFGDAEFDFLYTNAIDHFFVDRFLGECKRVLRPGGKLLIELPASYNPEECEAMYWSDDEKLIAHIAGMFSSLSDRNAAPGVLQLVFVNDASLGQA